MTAGRRIALVLILALMLAPTSRVFAQSPPIQATIFFKNPPPGAIPSFNSTTPITIVVQVTNTSGAQLVTTAGFSRMDFFRLLYFTLNQTGSAGPTVVNTSGALLHQHPRVGQCLSLLQNGVSVLQTPAIPVLPVELLAGSPSPFFVEYVIPDARAFYRLVESGRYTVKASIPFSTFSSADPNTLITNCENFSGPVLNVGGVGTGHQDFTIVSNTLDFRLCCLTFVGFAPPVGSEATCSLSPCMTANFGNTVPVKFQLFDSTGAVVRDAVATISVTQITGTPPPQPPTDLGQGSQPTNTFKFDSTNNQYVFNLDTSVLAVGIWRVQASISDGSVHSVEIQLR
jgi:hypothetical protein